MFYSIDSGAWDKAGTMDQVMQKAEAGRRVSIATFTVSQQAHDGHDIRELAPVVQDFKVILAGGRKALLPLEGPTMPVHAGWPGMEALGNVIEVDGQVVQA